MVLSDSMPFRGGGGGHRRHGAYLQAPMGAQELWARGRGSWRRKNPCSGAAALLVLSAVADSTSALSESFKFFFPLRKVSSSFQLCPFIEVEFVIYSISFIYV